MTKKIRTNELSEDELDCVTGGTSTLEDEASLRMAKAVSINPVAAKSNKLLPKSLEGKAMVAGRPMQKANNVSAKPIESVRTTNVGNTIKGRG